MSTVKMCDVCGKVAEKMAVKVTEDKPREVWEACTVECYLKGRREREAQR
ncbi:hypothetical protein [Arthrobacter sp. UYCu723]